MSELSEYLRASSDRKKKDLGEKNGEKLDTNKSVFQNISDIFRKRRKNKKAKSNGAEATL